MAKRKLAVKCLTNKICLANSATTINYNEFRFVRIVKFS